MEPLTRRRVVTAVSVAGFTLGVVLSVVFTWDLVAECLHPSPTGVLQSLPKPLRLLGYAYALIVPFRFTTTIARAYLDFALRRELPPYPEGKWPRVAVVVPVYRERESIERSLQSLDALAYPGAYEVIVVLDGEDEELDGTPELVRIFLEERSRDGKFQLLQKPNGGKASALNHGIAAAERSGVDLVFCIDGDAVVAPEALEKLVLHFHGTQVVAVTGQVKANNWLGGTGAGEHGAFPFWEGVQALEYVGGNAFLKRAQSLLKMVTIIPGPAGLFRMDALRAIAAETVPHGLCGRPTHPSHGPYPYDTLAEDMDLTFLLLRWSWRHGLGGIVYEPGAVVKTDGRHHLKDLFRQRYRWMRGTLTSAARHFHDWARRLDGEPRRVLTRHDVKVAWTVALVLVAAILGLWANAHVGTLAAGAILAVVGLALAAFHWLRTDREPQIFAVIAVFLFETMFWPPVCALANIFFIWLAVADWHSSAPFLIAWFFCLMLLDLLAATFSVVAEGSSLWLLPYSFLAKPVYVLMLDTFKVVAMIDVVFSVPAVWHQRYVRAAVAA